MTEELIWESFLTRSTSELTDIIFEIPNSNGSLEESSRIYAHRFVLCIKSPVFKIMLDRKDLCNYTQESNKYIIPITNISVKPFELLLTLVYSPSKNYFFHCQDLNAPELIDIFYLVKKYQIENLLTFLNEHILNQAKKTIYLFFEFFNLIYSWEEPNLISAFFHYFSIHFDEFTNHEAFYKLPLPLLKYIMHHDEIEVKESSIIKALCSWCKLNYECSNMSQVFEETGLRNCIRIGNIQCDDISLLPEFSAIIGKRRKSSYGTHLYTYQYDFDGNALPKDNFKEIIPYHHNSPQQSISCLWSENQLG